jgi:glucose/arabinose dehydrogenase
MDKNPLMVTDKPRPLLPLMCKSQFMKKYKRFYSLFLATLVLCCNNASREEAQTSVPGAETDISAAALSSASQSLPLGSIKLPEGFSISVFAEVEGARSMAMSPGGTLFVGNRDGSSVFAVKDIDGDFKADKRWVLASGLNQPNGVAFRDGTLYIAEISRISKIENVEERLNNPGKLVTVFDKYPKDEHHGWKYIAFGPDGKLYVPVGAPCNICESKEDVYASITRMNADGTGMEVYVTGVRNSVGFTWHPETKNMWFTDNGRDMLGDDVPPCELNTATKKGEHFGYPYCHGGSIKDPEFGNKRACGEFVKPAQALGAHVAPLGLKFYTGSMFPASYRNQIVLAEHGSWNRSKKSGYRLSLVKLDTDSKVTSYETFASGWMNEATQKVWGRPVDVLVLTDGSMLVSDDYAGVIYRITYKG